MTEIYLDGTVCIRDEYGLTWKARVLFPVYVIESETPRSFHQICPLKETLMMLVILQSLFIPYLI
ncbi:MAG: hypothetical protein KAU52_06170 [Methanosarcinales archaeon]|nr:hypothetical protein [Methanosarcinales archaeon]